MDLTPRREARCSALCRGVWILFSLKIESFVAQGIGSTIPTTQRLLHCLPNTHWTWRTVELAAAFIEQHTAVPADVVLNFIIGIPTDWDLTLRELELAYKLIPNPQLTLTTNQKLVKYNDVEGDLLAHHFIFPVSQLTPEIVDVTVRNRAAPLGKFAPRFCGTMRVFAADRQGLANSSCNFPRARHCTFVPKSALEAKKMRRGVYRGLGDDAYIEWHREFIEKCVQAREVMIGVYDDHLLPRSSRNFLFSFDGLMCVGNQFVMGVHRNRFTRSICERDRTFGSAINRHIDDVVGLLRSLENYVAYKIDKKDKVIEALAPYAL